MLQVVLSEDHNNLSVSQVLSNQDQKFKISKQSLENIVNATMDRLFAEEIDEIEKLNGPRNIEAGLITDFIKGLKGDDLRERDEQYGNNLKPDLIPKTYWQLLMAALDDLIMKILLAASVLSIAIEVGTADAEHKSLAWIEGFAIFIAVFVCCNVTAVNDYQKERQFQSLNKIADDRKTVTVFRDGMKLDMHQTLVMVGDIIQIFEGMEIPADCLVIEAAELSTDESAMTGETDPIKKDTYEHCLHFRNKYRNQQSTMGRHDVPSPIMLSGTKVLSGEGKMVVLVVGDSSCVGKIAALLRSDEDGLTPLQEKLEKIAQDIGKFGLASALLIVLVLLIRFMAERISEGEFDETHLQEMLNFIIIGITVIVVAIPEGLPLAVTLSLAYSTKRMLKDNNLVRKLAACETMGGADMICSDKTGTLTQNKMYLVQIYNDSLLSIDPYATQLQLSDYYPESMKELFIQSAIVNGTAMLRPEQKGSKTEIAILLFGEQCGIDYEKERSIEVSMKIPFSSQRKRMSMIINNKLFIKGASELIVGSCTHYHSKNKGIIKIDNEINNEIQNAIFQMANQSLRTIGIAYCTSLPHDLSTKDEKGVYDFETHDLILLGILGIKDILRQEVPEAVSLCKTAGIKVRMVTGDNKITAQAIARECGILISEQDSLVMEGPEFMAKIGGVVCKQCRTPQCDCPRDQGTAQRLGKSVRIDTIKDGATFDSIYRRIDVLARSRPEDKYALVTGLLERGHVVAVTGDGTNDAPALKKADVGFAMGIAGTEVARESASIILLDDNFNSIVKAVMWGRNIYDSIKKFLQFQLTVNVVAVFLTLISSVLLKQEILEPIQMLWVNLIMDTFASLALATETPTPELLQRKPHNRNEYIISNIMLKHIIGQAILQITILLIILFLGETFLPEYDGFEDGEDDGFLDNLQYKYSNTYFINGEYTCPNHKIYCNIMASGKDFYIDGSENYLKFYKDSYIPSRQFTFIFNLFVMLQLFNFINARRIRDEFNIFDRIFTNILFPIIVIGIFVFQIIIVTFGGMVFHCYSFYGLRVQHWLICIGFGLTGLVWSSILKMIPNYDFFKRQAVHLQKKVRNISHNDNVFDLVKIKVRLDEHFYIFSRFLISRMLTLSRIKKIDAIQIAKDIKKQLIDRNLLEIKSNDLETIIFQTMEKFGYANNIQKYQMVSNFYRKRTPMIIIIFGAPCMGKSLLANNLAERLNISNVLQIDIVEMVMRSIDINQFKDTFSFEKECRIIRQGVSTDISKCLSEGKAVIIEGVKAMPYFYLECDFNDQHQNNSIEQNSSINQYISNEVKFKKAQRKDLNIFNSIETLQNQQKILFPQPREDDSEQEIMKAERQIQELAKIDQNQALIVGFLPIISRNDHRYNIENNLSKKTSKEVIEQKLECFQKMQEDLLKQSQKCIKLPMNLHNMEETLDTMHDYILMRIQNINIK